MRLFGAIMDRWRERQYNQGQAYVLEQCGLKGRSTNDVQKEVIASVESAQYIDGAMEAIRQMREAGKP